MSRKPWPKLSETLPGQMPGRCQQCDAGPQAEAEPLTYWQECDDDDRGTRVFIVLCQPCADRIIEPHPRLYRQQSDVMPMPGAMPVCLDCRYRERMDCVSPTAKFNGGPGLKYEPEGNYIHLCRSPRSKSGWKYWAPGPVETCSGKEPAFDDPLRGIAGDA